jgi:hypothetical protein
MSENVAGRLGTVSEVSLDDDDRLPILASDSERERSVTLLREAVGEGRLTLEEFSQRVELAQTARTDLELAQLARDLPAAPGAAAPTPAATPALAGDAPEEHRALFSHLIRQGPWALPARSSWRSIFGTIDLDLRQARLAETDSELRVHNVFGTVTVLVPDGVEVVVQGGGLFASQKIESPEHPPVAGGPRLFIHCSGPGGTLHVRARPTLKASLKRALKG